MAILHEPPTPGDERFSLRVSTVDGETRIDLQGPLDLDTVTDLRQLGEALRGTSGSACLDLGGCTFVDSTGVSGLLAFKGELDMQLRQLTVVCIPPKILDVLRMLGVDEALGLP